MLIRCTPSLEPDFKTVANSGKGTVAADPVAATWSQMLRATNWQDLWRSGLPTRLCGRSPVVNTYVCLGERKSLPFYSPLSGSSNRSSRLIGDAGNDVIASHGTIRRFRGTAPDYRIGQGKSSPGESGTGNSRSFQPHDGLETRAEHSNPTHT